MTSHPPHRQVTSTSLSMTRWPMFPFKLLPFKLRPTNCCGLFVELVQPLASIGSSSQDNLYGLALNGNAPRACQLNIIINDNHITQVTRHRHLGVTFNERLSWKDHVHDVINKSAKKIGLLRRLGRQLSSTVVRDLYAFSIRLGVEYGSIAWSGLSSSDAARLERFKVSSDTIIG